jgi:hypothetical protein
LERTKNIRAFRYGSCRKGIKGAASLKGYT